MEKRFLDIKEVADLTGLSVPSLNRHMKDGTLPSHKVGARRLFEYNEVIEWIMSHDHRGLQKKAERRKPTRAKKR